MRRRSSPLAERLRHLYLVGFVLLAAASVSVVRIPGATAGDSNSRADDFEVLIAHPKSRADDFRVNSRALYFLSVGQSQRGPVPTARLVELFCVNRASADGMANPHLATATFPALSPLRWRTGRSSDEQPSVVKHMSRKRTDNRADQVAAFTEVGAFRQGRPELHMDGLVNSVLIPKPLSVGLRSFTSSKGRTITYTLIMAPNASGNAFGPRVYMDAHNQGMVCAISQTDAETISAFRNSLADAFIQEAADPGRGLPSVNVDQSIADDWAVSAMNGIMARCMVVNQSLPSARIALICRSFSSRRTTIWV